MNLSSESAEQMRPLGRTRSLLRRHPLLSLWGVLFLHFVIGLATQKYWNAHDAVVYIDQGETFLNGSQSGPSLLYTNPHHFIQIGFHYLGTAFQVISYRIFDDILGPHLISLIAISLVTILVWHWAYLRSGRVQTAYLCALAILFEPILHKSIYGNRLDIYAFFWGFVAFWMFERVRHTPRSWAQDGYFFGIGFCYVTACFVWMTSLIWGPFGLAYAIDIALEKRWKFITYVRRFGWALLGVLVATVLITSPLWSRWSQVVYETVVGFSFAANPPWSLSDHATLTRCLHLVIRSPILLLPWLVFALRRPNSSILMDSHLCSDQPHRLSSTTDERPPCQSRLWLYGVAIGVAICGIFRTFVYPFRVLYLVPMMLFLLHELITRICETNEGCTDENHTNEARTNDSRTDQLERYRLPSPRTYSFRRIFTYVLIGMIGIQTVDVCQNAHKLYRQRAYRSSDWVVDAFREVGITQCSVAIHSWHLYLVGRKLDWKMYSSSYFNPADVLQIPEVEYAILEPDGDQSEAFRQGLLDQKFEYVTTLCFPMSSDQTYLDNTRSSHYGPYELWRRSDSRTVQKVCTNSVSCFQSPMEHPPMSET